MGDLFSYTQIYMKPMQIGDLKHKIIPEGGVHPLFSPLICNFFDKKYINTLHLKQALNIGLQPKHTEAWPQGWN
jgi:hypothetical protein